MRLNRNGLPAKLLKAFVEREKRDNREKPTRPFVGEKKQMWYFLMNQIDQAPQGESGKHEETEEG